ncbi:DUF3564 family protein [Burkholderia sp. Bp9090]|uniref:DUF3564 family protein n=1 Tax=Burkholderia sp. Bp9090 TaxID=2184567 RepID=UPI000F5E0AB9|nr:DUF3564 family protein [Burkholderia sp. Bp9090]RQZ38487.1 DUF3564 family protein [Burkholderia sp. Bp9090]
MRITVHLDTFAHAGPSAYAIVWLDFDEQKWSCEGHYAMAMPSWGTLARTGDGIRLAVPDASRPLVVLDGFASGNAQAPTVGASGMARWYPHAHHAPDAGRWRVQCLDTEQAEPEHRLFADDAC